MPINLTQKQIIIIGAAVLLVLIGAVVFLLNIRSTPAGQGAVKLTIWGTDSVTAFNDVIQSYAGPGSGTQSEIKYTQIDPSQYQSKLLAALAAGPGRIFLRSPTAICRSGAALPRRSPPRLRRTFNQVTLQTDFPDVVSQDFVSGRKYLCAAAFHRHARDDL